VTEAAILVPAAVALDALLGEPRRGHPLAGFGAVVATTEARLNRGRLRRMRGLVAVVLLVAPIAAGAWALASIPGWTGSLFAILVLYLCLGGRSLGEHARAVAGSLGAGDLAGARRGLSNMVGRDTAGLDRSGMATATVESVLENGADATFGALLWFVVGGAPLVVAYRLVNTLDAMWGYRGGRYADFGWAAARLDDLLNWPVARLTAATYAALGDAPRALVCWRHQGGVWKSANAGAVMASGAGALGLRMGGTASYAGRREERPTLGTGRAPSPADIGRSLGLVRRGLLLWVAVIVLGGWLLG